MAEYNSYNGVMHLQKEVLGIGVHEADGKYGPDTDALYQVWLAGQFAAGRTEEAALSAAGMSRRSIRDIMTAIAEFRALLVSDPEVATEAAAAATAAGVTPGAIGGGIGAPLVGGGELKEEPEEGWPWWKWALVLAGGVVVVGGVVWYMKKQRAMGAFGDLEDGTGGCSCPS